MDLMEVYAVAEAQDTQLQGLLEQCAVNVVGFTKTFSVARQDLGMSTPDLILYNPRGDGGSEFSRIQEITQLSPHAALIVLAATTDADYVRECLRAGAEDYLMMPIDAVLLGQKMVKAHQRNLHRYTKETLSVLMDRFTNKPRVIGFISGKGGVGKTTLAVNTGVSLAQMGKKVILVDLDADLGGTEMLLGIEPKHTLSDLADVPIEEIPARIGEFVEWHESGLAILCAPRFSNSPQQLTDSLLRMVLQALQRNFQLIVVDMPPVLDNHFLSVVEMAHECYMVSTPNLTVLMTNHRVLNLFKNLEFDASKVKHVLNCAGVRQGVKETDAQRLLQAPITASIRYDFHTAERAANSGQPVVVMTGRSVMSKGIQDLARSIAGSARAGNDEKATQVTPADTPQSSTST